MHRKVNFSYLAVIIVYLSFGQLSASPDTSRLEDFTDPFTEESFTLIHDTMDPNLFYRFPDYFSVKKDANGKSIIRSNRAANGDLKIEIIWGTRDFSESRERLLSLVRGKLGRNITIVTLNPRLERLEFDSDFERFHPVLDNTVTKLPKFLTPSDSFKMELTIPKSEISETVDSLISGSGYTLLVQAYYLLSDFKTSTQPVVFQYATSLLLGGLEACDVDPDFSCEGG